MQEIAGIEALGRPGIEPRWTHSSKDGVGTAYSAWSPLWFKVWNGIVTEVYYPAIDRPQLRDTQDLMTDGSTFFQEEKRDLKIVAARKSEHALGYRCTSSDSGGRYTIVKQILGDPHLRCLQQGHEFRDQTLRSLPISRFMLFVLPILRLVVRGTMPICMRFTLFWTQDNRWEGRDDEVTSRQRLD
jgi:glucoamylase